MFFNILLILNGLVIIKSAKILGVYPTPSISHQVVFRKLTLKLVELGHDVVVITTDPVFSKTKSPKNLVEIDVHDISYDLIRNMAVNHTVGEHRDKNHDAKTIGRFVAIAFETQLSSADVQELITNENNKFDLILVEAMARPALIFSHIFNAPVILFSSLGGLPHLHDVVGSPSHPFLYPSFFNNRFYNLTLWEKLENLYTYLIIRTVEYSERTNEDIMLRKYFGPDIPSVNELLNNVNMLFLNIHPIWADNQPVPPGLVYLGGLHQTDTKELPKDLKEFMDSSKHGVIYVSFGSNVLPSMVSSRKIEIILNTLSQLPYNVLFKWSQNDFTVESKNIKVLSWVPQSDLLKHPNLKLFITQAGLQSTDEAITAEVPLLGIPMFADQWYNAEKYVLHGIGKKLELKELTEELLRNTIEEIIHDDSYRRNIRNLRNLMLDQPQSPLERAVWWVEHVIRHGGAKHLRAPAANISWCQYLEIEVVLVIWLVAILILVAIVLNYVLLRKLVILIKTSINTDSKIKYKRS